jgi:Na+-transporting methylmalonyl-CoA/oxaloacetate decarboxylase beta subunit
LGAPSFAIVERFHVTRAVDSFNVLAVASVGPNGITPGWTDIYVATGLVPLVFVAVIVNSYSVPAVSPVTSYAL